MTCSRTVAAGVSVVSFIGGFLAYVIGLRIQNQIAANNEKLEKELNQLRSDIADVDKILAVVNGKYVRTDLFNQAQVNTANRFESLKEIIEANMTRLEDVLDNQIASLKERIK